MTDRIACNHVHSIEVSVVVILISKRTMLSRILSQIVMIWIRLHKGLSSQP